MKCEKPGNHTISYQSLLLSTTVLNDYRITIALKMLHHLSVAVIEFKLKSSALKNTRGVMIENK